MSLGKKSMVLKDAKARKAHAQTLERSAKRRAQSLLGTIKIELAIQWVHSQVIVTVRQPILEDTVQIIIQALKSLYQSTTLTKKVMARSNY